MKRSIRLCLFTLLFSLLMGSALYADRLPLARVIGPTEVEVLLKENTYYVDHTLTIKGTLIIEPGTRIEFYQGGRIIVGSGGRIIADGFAQLTPNLEFPTAVQTQVNNNGITSVFGPEGYASMRCFLYPALEVGAERTSLNLKSFPNVNDRRNRERTVHPSKYSIVFNVGLNTGTRELYNYVDNGYTRYDAANADGTWAGIENAIFSGLYPLLGTIGDDSIYMIPYETAILLHAARLNGDNYLGQWSIQQDNWKRANGESARVTPAKITFIGQPQSNQSNEYGHIIVLPGAGAAFFRNCVFENLKKDTIVDVDPFYHADREDAIEYHPRLDLLGADMPSDIDFYYDREEALNTLNEEMLRLSNGGGGAITTFSSRTWLVDCEFTKNFARLRGGAVQILQAPTAAFFNNDRDVMAADFGNVSDATLLYYFWGVLNDFYEVVSTDYYDVTTLASSQNKNVVDPNNDASTVLNRYYENSFNYGTFEYDGSLYPALDRLYSADLVRQGDLYNTGVGGEFFNVAQFRAPWDDARVAGMLGRFRNLTFTNNMVRLSNTGTFVDGGLQVFRDDTTTAAPYPYPHGNVVEGGALYISGTDDDPSRDVEFGLGINDLIGLGDASNFATGVNPNEIGNQTGVRDYLRFEGNSAQNYQDNRQSGGARGGAIYVGKNTSLIVAGEFINNYTSTKFFVDTEGDGKGNVGAIAWDYPTQTYYDDGRYSLGGAIYSDPVNGRLQIRGGVNEDEARKLTTTTSGLGSAIVPNTTLFEGNKAGLGGAIYVESLTSGTLEQEALLSPYIGGGAGTAARNGRGSDIVFRNNEAFVAGGAIYTGRGMAVYGAGGKDDGYTYTVNKFVNFDENNAGFAGGAIHVDIPTSTTTTSRPISNNVVNLERARFTGNAVHKLAYDNRGLIINTDSVITSQVRGGGAIYLRNAGLNVVKGSQFENNFVYNGNGAAIATVNARREIPRFFMSDLDVPGLTTTTALEAFPGVASTQPDLFLLMGITPVMTTYTAYNNPFTYGANANGTGWDNVLFPDESKSPVRIERSTANNYGWMLNMTPIVITSDIVPSIHKRMLTSFENNVVVVDSALGNKQITEYGNTQVTSGYILPDNTFNAQWWFDENTGFIGGANGWINKIYPENGKTRWGNKYNHTYTPTEAAANGIIDWGANTFKAMYFHNPNRGYFADNNAIWFYQTDAGAKEGYTITRLLDRNSIDAATYGTTMGEITDLAFAGPGSDASLITTVSGQVWASFAGWQGGNFGTVTNMDNNKRLNKVHMASNLLAYAVGDDGAIIRLSGNGVNAWGGTSVMAPGIRTNWHAVSAIDNGSIVAVGGEKGELLFTGNSGGNWQYIGQGIFNSGETLTDMEFILSKYDPQYPHMGYIVTNLGNVYKFALNIYGTSDNPNIQFAITNITPPDLGFSSYHALQSVQVLDDRTLVVTGAHDFVYKGKFDGTVWTWTNMHPHTDFLAKREGSTRLHGGIANLVENGVGLGGAIYALDYQPTSSATKDIARPASDFYQFNRVRIQDNHAFSGSAIYSDNYNLPFKFERSLIRGNHTDTLNTVGLAQNLINGPYNKTSTTQEYNLASSDLAATTLYGEMENAFPNDSRAFSTRANSIYDNEARFLIRLPDAPNTKSIPTATASQHTGVTILTGNYWGKTEANVGLMIMNRQSGIPGQDAYAKDHFMTFFVEKKVKGVSQIPDQNYLPFYNDDTLTTYTYLGGAKDYRRQGPFEWNMSDYVSGAGTGPYNDPSLPSSDRKIWGYRYIELDNDNADGWEENVPAAGTIPEKYLFSGDIYDKYDKGVAVKVAEYAGRRMFPIEDFAVGNPTLLQLPGEYTDSYDERGDAHSSKYVKRYIYNPEYSHAVESVEDDGTINYQYPTLFELNSTSWKPMKEEGIVANNAPKYYHPLGVPLFLEAKANWFNRQDVASSNFDIKHQASTVFFVINETTQDYIRVDLKQIPTTSFAEEGTYSESDALAGLDERFRATVYFVPDSSNRGDGTIRRSAEQLKSWGSDGEFPFGESEGTYLLNALSPRNTTGGFDGAKGIDTAAYYEDFGALIGRKYSVISDPTRTFFNMGDMPRGLGDPIIKLFPNRPDMPKDNGHIAGQAGGDAWGTNATTATRTTFFAGERYGTLPVNVGDVIRVVSRSVLWKQGPEKAYEGGLVFQIAAGPEAPEFIGHVSMWGDTLRNPYVTDENGNWPVVPGRQDENGQYTPDTIKNYDLLNKVFVRTNRSYPWNGTGVAYSDESRLDNDRGTDFILTAAAIDRNNFYDPRNLLDLGSDSYTGLIYNWSVVEEDPTKTGLIRWLSASKSFNNIALPDNEGNTANVKGYLEFKGHPINPYIIPGGESIQLSVRNYAPGVEMVDSLLTVLDSDNKQDTIRWFYQTFPPYLNAPKYNADPSGAMDTVARYLQQDTLGARASSQIVSDDITIFVMDSLPRFIDFKPRATTEAPATFLVKDALYNENNPSGEKYVFGANDTVYVSDREYSRYNWSRSWAGLTVSKLDGTEHSPRHKVNFAGVPGNADSYKLRFKMDINTDDEMEDLSAERAQYPTPWHFPYGRSAYSFSNTTIHGGVGDNVADTVDNADTLFSNDVPGTGIMQLKPSWLRVDNFFNWDDGDDAPTAQDAATMHFQRRGQINFRMDSSDVNTYLRKSHTEGEQYHTDTMMSIVSNDGHGGLASKQIDLYVNFQPRVLTTELPNSVEGREYNFKKDENIGIKIFDANSDQKHTFSLLKASNFTGTTVDLDPAFPSETRFTFPDETWGKTPEWLNIDPVSGVLYGTPAIVTNLRDTNAFVTVLIMDEDSLYTIVNIPLKQTTGNCPPEVVAVDADMDCIVRGRAIDNAVIVFDRDLIRFGENNETDTLTLQVNTGGAVSDILQIVPAKLGGDPTNPDAIGYDTVRLVNIGAGGLNLDALWDQIVANNYKLPVEIIVTDRSGLSDTFRLELGIANTLDFLSTITITNRHAHSQALEWGVGANATTGMTSDKYGVLDIEYCEMEVPPLPWTDVFDARWSIPTIVGTHRNIYPRIEAASDPRSETYMGLVQPGGVSGSASDAYPITYTWDVTEIPAPGVAGGSNPLNPSNACWYFQDPHSRGNYFKIRMHDGEPLVYSEAGTMGYTKTGDIVEFTLLDNTVSANFNIVYTSHVDVEDEYALVTGIKSVSPSPVYSGQTDANIEFSLAKSGDISLEMFDMLGNKVITIANAYYPAGSHTLNFNLTDSRSNRLSSGAYTIRLTAGVEVKQFKLIVLQ